MYIALSLYALIFLLFIWSYCGYLLTLTTLALIYHRKPRGDSIMPHHGTFPRIAMVVPCQNEKGLVDQKVRNCEAMQYDGGLEIYFAHGLSGDGTAEEILSCIAGKSRMHLLECGCTGKIPQLNTALAAIRTKADIVVCSDMDAVLEADAVAKIAEEFMTREEVWVVGAVILPLTAMAIEERYWQDQNLMRSLESRISTSSIVVAPCYAFRSNLLQSFPADCVADDVFVSFLANTLGWKTSFLETITGQEVRTPKNIFEFLYHKYRKGNAFFLEVLRFLYRLPEMRGWWKIIYLTKFLQIAVIPWLLPLFFLSMISFMIAGGLFMKVAVFTLMLTVISLIIVTTTLDVYQIFRRQKASRRKGGLVLPFILSNIVLIAVALSFPFYRQSSCYGRMRKQDDPIPVPPPSVTKDPA